MVAQRGPSDFGATLRAARERRGLSLRQIANATKISMITLEALERNDISRLPGGIFSRAFVRSYALEVGLDPETTIEEFMGLYPQDAVTAGHPTTSPIEDHESVESDRRMASTFLRLFAISVPLAGLVLYLGMSGRPAPNAPAGPRTETVVAPRQVAPAPQPEAAPVAVQRPPVDPPAGAAVPADHLTVQVSAVRNSWVSAIVDGRRDAQREFRPGEEQTFEVHKEIVLTTGDTSAVTVTINGMPTKPFGGSGQVVTTRVNLTNYKEYLLAP